MSFFSGSDGTTEDPDEAASLERVESGGIPLRAEQRLKELVGSGAPFTSTLSVNEFALLSKLGPTSLGQVMGASVHQVGWQYLPASARWGNTVTVSLDQVAHAWDQARRRAFDRLAEEARLLAADAVLGVTLRRGAHDWAAHCVDYVVTGTAIRLPGSTGNRYPVLSDLSVQDYWKLSDAGWVPAHLCATTAVYFVSMSTGTKFNTWMTANQNQELRDYSRGFTAARTAAIRQLRSQASSEHANGLVGVSLDHAIHEASFKTLSGYGYGPGGYGAGGYGNQGGRDDRDGVAITIHAIGTAIRAAAEPADTTTTTTVRLGS